MSEGSPLEYSDTLVDHFTNPRNVGTIEDADGVGKMQSPSCGDLIHVHIKVKDGRLDEVKFKTFGCAAAIASGSMLTELVKGRRLDQILGSGVSEKEAIEAMKAEIVEALGGMPKQKVHCSLLAADGLMEAVKDYQSRQETGS